MPKLSVRSLTFHLALGRVSGICWGVWEALNFVHAGWILTHGDLTPGWEKWTVGTSMFSADSNCAGQMGKRLPYVRASRLRS